MLKIEADISEVIEFGKQAGLSLGDVSKATRKAAAPIVTAAKAAAPVKSGRLRRSIRPVSSKFTVRVRAGGTKTVRYAGPAHWGVTGVGGPRFLTRAADSTLPAVLAILDREINDQIGNLAK